VAVASKLASSAAPHKPITFEVPNTYQPKKGPNKWKDASLMTRVEALIRLFDTDRDYIVSADELHTILVHAQPDLTRTQSIVYYSQLLEQGFDTNGDGQISVEELAVYWCQKNPELAERATNERRVTLIASSLMSEPASPPKAPPTAHETAGLLATTAPELPAPDLPAVALPADEDAPRSDPLRDLSDRVVGLFAPKAAAVGVELQA